MLDFLAEVTQHIVEKGEHLLRYYGWYSHRQRGIRAKRRKADEPEPATVRIDRSALKASESAASGPRAGSVSTWAMLIKRVYEVDPLACPSYGGRMKVISFIERRQADVIERVLRHCGLWEGPLHTLANPRAPPHAAERTPSAPHELECVPDSEYLEAEFREIDSEASRELQLVFEPDFL